MEKGGREGWKKDKVKGGKKGKVKGGKKGKVKDGKKGEGRRLRVGKRVICGRRGRRVNGDK